MRQLKDLSIVTGSNGCMQIARKAQEELKALNTQFKTVAVVGPRQSGKTTLVQMTFPDKVYVNLENPDTKL